MNLPAFDLRPLAVAPPADVCALHNDPRVRRHMPLASGLFDYSAFQKWLANKEALQRQYGYAPWSIWVGGSFAGWGGFQFESGDPELALVLAPEFWGYGKAIYKELIRRGFETFGFESFVVLLPPQRLRRRVLFRLGYVEEGEIEIGGQPFIRFRLAARGSIVQQ
jgi:[ribosomal protein S5]-alanine N-acetyltransferase